MGLYLCLFEDDNEIDGVEVGSYSDFEYFRNSITDLLESGRAGSRFPVLITHSDSDGEWSSAACEELKMELTTIAQELQDLPGVGFRVEWQKEVARSMGLCPSSLYESFIDVDGEPLIERLIHLCDLALQRNRPILFQ